MPNNEGRELLSRLRNELVGFDIEVPLLFGGTRRYVSLDNAASTPTFECILERVDEFLRFYANVHRGEGFRSRLSSWAYDEARKVVAEFVKADPEKDAVIFTKNTTESLNKLSRLFRFRPDGVCLTSIMEHHSNELPWRRVARVEHVAVHDDGSLDLEDYDRKLAQFAGRLDLVALTAASNVSGWVNPIGLLARKAHEAGARFVLDAAQLAAHRPLDMKPHGHPEHVDFLAFSAHKMYAPYGVGALVGDREELLKSGPESVGGGTVDIVTLEDAYFRDLPDREEAGTPDIVGVVALGAAIRLLQAVGWDAITEHENRLTRYALEKLRAVPGLRIYGSSDPADVERRLGVIAFNVEGHNHSLVAAILSHEAGIGVRGGCFCAHPYMLRLLAVSEVDAEKVRAEIIARDRSNIPGAVRASFGVYNDESDADALVVALQLVAGRGYRGRYRMSKETGTCFPENAPGFDFARYYCLAPRGCR
jgi:cysteine desulfurase / selenocysteine lyase